MPDNEIMKIAKLGKQHSENFQSYNFKQDSIGRVIQNPVSNHAPSFRSQNAMKIGIQRQQTIRGGSVVTVDRRLPVRKQSMSSHSGITLIPNSKNIAQPRTATTALGGHQDNPLIPGIKPHLLQSLYQAKCKDLVLKPVREQEKRFYEYCQKMIADRRITLRESGLGENSA